VRGFKGWGRGRGSSNNTLSSDTVSDNSQAGQSLSYSTASSVQSAGESTASTEFSGMLKALDEADKKDPAKARYYTGGPASVSSSLNYSDSETSGHGRGKLSRGTSVNSNISTDYSTDQESQLEGTKLISVLLDEPIHKPIPNILGPTDYSSDEDEEHPFDLKFEAARSPKHRRSNRKVAPATADDSSTKTSQTGPSVASHDKVTVATKRKNVASGAASLNSSSGQEQGDSIVKERQQEQQQVPRQQQERDALGKEQQQQRPIPPPPQPEEQKEGEQIGSKQAQPSTRSTTKSKKRSSSLSGCGLEVIEDNIPSNVKTFLRPFLCGIL